MAEEKTESTTTEPTPEQIAAARSAAAFGSEAKSDVPDPASTKSDKADPEAGKTPAAEAKKDDTPGEALFFGKYKTMEAAAAAVKDKETFIETLKRENKELREKAATVPARGADGRFEPKVPPEGDADTATPTKEQLEIQTAFDELSQLLGDKGKQALEILLGAQEKKFNERLTPVEAKTAQDEDQEVMKEFLSTREDLAEDPEFGAQFVETSQWAKEEAKTNKFFTHEMLYYATIGRNLPAHIDKLVAAKEAELTAKIKAKLTAGGAGGGSLPGKGGGEDSTTTDRSKKAFGLE